MVSTRARLGAGNREKTHNCPNKSGLVDMEEEFQAGHWVDPDREMHVFDIVSPRNVGSWRQCQGTTVIELRFYVSFSNEV